MDKATDPILDAALGVFARYGKRKTTMGDIAAEAGVSRQTLYGRFDNKDGVLRAVIHYVSDQVLARIVSEWASTENLGDKLWIYFEHAVIGMLSMLPMAVVLILRGNCGGHLPLLQRSRPLAAVRSSSSGGTP